MSITYSYQITRVDVDARCMDISYSAEGHQTMHIGVRLPFVDESLEDVIGMYAPIAYWLAQIQPVQIPQVGTSGTIVPPPAFTEVVPHPEQPTVEGAQTL